MKYEFENGSMFYASKVDAQSVGEELNNILSEEGKLETEAVLERAKDKKSPIHAAFEWNDKVAALDFRLMQARRLIKCTVSVDDITGNRDPVFVNVRLADGSQYYQSIESAITNPDEWESVIRYARAALHTAYARLDQLEKFEGRQSQIPLSLIGRAKEFVSKASESISANG
jgi:hypothetical protein